MPVVHDSVENAHKAVKSKWRYRQWCQRFDTASNVIDGMESMRMIQKGQIKKISKGNIRSQNKFLNKLFYLAA